MDDNGDDETTVGELIDPAQAAWAQYVSRQYLNRDAINHAHRAFIAGHKAGWSEGFEAGKQPVDQHLEP